MHSVQIIVPVMPKLEMDFVVDLFFRHLEWFGFVPHHWGHFIDKHFLTLLLTLLGLVEQSNRTRTKSKIKM